MRASANSTASDKKPKVSSKFRNEVFKLIEHFLPSPEELRELSVELDQRSKSAYAKEDVLQFNQTFDSKASHSNLFANVVNSHQLSSSPSRMIRSHSSLPPPKRDTYPGIGPDEFVKTSFTKLSKKSSIEFVNIGLENTSNDEYLDCFNSENDFEESEEYVGDKKPPIKIGTANQHTVEYKVLEDGGITRTPTSRGLIRMWWHTKPRKVLLVKKQNVVRIAENAKEIILWLNQTHGLKTIVEPAVIEEEIFKGVTCVETWKSLAEFKLLHEKVDFLVCLGGDGTLLWLNSLFNGLVPPVISFAMGSLGFLTRHSVESYRESLNNIINGGFFLSLRGRLVCRVYRNESGSDDSELDEDELENIKNDNHAADSINHSKNFIYQKGKLEKTLIALNEVVIDRGNCPYLTELDCFLNGKYFTRARADGLIISTATGSTAYSLSAGGSLLHPEVPAILFTPVCAHSLSFRPMIFPDGFRLHIQVYKHARGTACVTCDGKNRIELAKGDYVEIECSMHPLPSICLDSETEEWFKAVRSGLQWNTRGS